jgi:hypothetical protein
MTEQDIILVPSVEDFYLIKLTNPTDCTLHPMIILYKRDDKSLIILSSEVTLDSKLDESLIQDLIDAATLYKENDMIDFLWQSSNNITDNSTAAIVAFNGLNQADITVNDEILTIEVVSKWTLDTYKEAY